MLLFSVKYLVLDLLKLAGIKIRNRYEAVKSTGSYIKSLLLVWKSHHLIVQMLVNMSVLLPMKWASATAVHHTGLKVSIELV